MKTSTKLWIAGTCLLIATIFAYRSREQLDGLEWFILALSLVVLGLGAGAEAKERRQKVQPVWSKAAKQLGFKVLGNQSLQYDRLKGAKDGFEVVVGSTTWQWGGKWTDYTTFEISSPKIPSDLLIEPESLLDRLKMQFAGPDIQTGDPEFDKRILVRGNEAAAKSLLNSHVRQTILELVDAYFLFQVKNGKIVCWSEGLAKNAFLIEAQTKQLIDFSKIAFADVSQTPGSFVSISK